jgi:glycosyltransferase involved in cell wall biosynthesis
MSARKPTISVVIPCYNGGRYLPETVGSVLAQTAPVDEIIVVDDGSTDDSLAIAKRLPGPIRVIAQSNQGESVARNVGIEESRGDWVAFLDADDLWAADKIAHQLALAGQADDVVCVHTGYEVFGARSEFVVREEYLDPRLYTVERLLIDSTIHISTAIVRRSAAVRFPTWTRHGEDMIYLSELSLQGSMAYIAGHLGGYRVHSAMQTRSPGYHRSHIASRLEWIDRAECRLGPSRADDLRMRIRKQLVAWIEHARWNRAWDRYWDLRSFGATLDWDGAPHAVVTERLYPSFLYKVKDWIATRRTIGGDLLLQR